MTVTAELLKTPLHARHLEHHARMVPFGGWDMPVQYASLRLEHYSVRAGVGMFDVSHMGEFRIAGPGALEFLQFVTTNDLSKLKVGRAQYNLLPNSSGGLVDDIYVYRTGELEYLMVVNASNIAKDFEHLESLKAGFEVMLEHFAVREGVGMFDVSHMGEFRVVGPGALEFLQYVTTNDLGKLKVGRAQYNLLPNAQGGLVDDIYVYRTGELEYLMVVNASNIAKDFAHLERLQAGFEVTLENVSYQYALLAVQGPRAEETLQPFSSVDLSSKKKNDVWNGELLGMKVLMARTGYTGEDGFEVFCAPEGVHALWNAFLERGVTPCGLGARDTLRLEAGFPLYGHEFSDDTNPLETHMAWAVKLGKDFYGKAALLEKPLERRLVGLELEGRGIAREGHRVTQGGRDIGYISSGTMSPTLKKGVALAFLERGTAIASSVQVEIRGVGVDARVVEPVFLPKSA